MPETEDFNVRVAEPEDVYELVQISKEFYESSHVTDKLSFSPKITGSFIELTIESDIYLTVVAEDGNKIVGGLIAALFPTFFSEDTQALCIAWYLDPKYRKLKHSMQLLKIYEEWAKESGAKLSNLANVDMESPKAFTKLGYEMVETVFSKELR
jgi:GNAT superfamily N-acetyltransferase